MRMAWGVLGSALAAIAAIAMLRPDPADHGAQRLMAAAVLEVGRERPRSPPDAGAEWRTIALPDNWDGRRPGYEGFVWYRIALPPTSTARPVLYVPTVGMNAELWIDRQRVGAFGRMDPPVTRHFYTPLLFELPTDVQAREALLLVAGVPGYRSGLAPVWLGTHAALYPAWQWRSFWQNQGTLATTVINLAIGVYVLLIGIRERSHKAYAWFGAAVVVWGLRNLNYVVTDPPVPDLLWAEIVVSGSAWFTGLFAIFAFHFSQAEDPGFRGPRWLPPAIGLYMLLASVHFLTAPDYGRANAGFAFLATVGIVLTAWSQWRLVRLAWRVRRPELAAVAGGAVLYLVLLLNDFSVGTDRESLGQYFVRQYAALPLFLAITATLVQRYLAALREAREASVSLKAQVDEQTQRLQASFARLREVEHEQARAQERARLMGDLHDGLGLHLVTALRQARDAEVSPAAVAATLQDCLDDLRVAIDSLDAHERDPLALLGSLRFRMAPRFESLGLRLEWRVDPELGVLPDLQADAALDLLRIVQEALTNGLKHSGARHIVMALRLGPDGGTVVEVSDDGRGFDLAAPARGRGLAHMRQRAARLGATIEWDNGPSGTVMRLSFRPWT